MRIALGSDSAIGRKLHATLDGRDFLAVKFEKVLIPKQAGTISVPQATVSMRAIQGYQRRGGNSMFDDFFSDGFSGDARFTRICRPLEHADARSQRPARRGPAGRVFTGLVGSYEIEADATPTDVSVGDPITVTLRVKGPRYLRQRFAAGA